jgi:hypothetical protein
MGALLIAWGAAGLRIVLDLVPGRSGEAKEEVRDILRP